MAKKLIADLMVDYLERRNVKYVFGLCGHTVIGMLDALSRSKKVKYISNRHEAVASTAADGYARVTHKASVVLCHLGPGLTNVLTGVANAAFDSIPMVVIAGDVPSYYFGKHPHQEVNMHGDATQYKILEPVVKRAWRVDDPEALGEIMDKAFRLAESGRPGPVLIDMPMDMFSREVEDYLWDRTYKDSHITMKPALDPEAAKGIAKKLVEAKNPVLHAGGGILLAQASDELADLAEFLDIPVSRTLMGQGCLPDNHPLMVGQTGFWGLEFTHSLTVNADVILGLGTRLRKRTAPAGIGVSPSIPTIRNSSRLTSIPWKLAVTILFPSGPLEISNWASNKSWKKSRKSALKGKRIRNCVPRLPKRRKPSRKAMLPFLRMAVSL